MVFKIGIVGNASSGKTTLAQYIKQRVGDDGLLVKEVAREYISNFGGIKNSEDQYHVGLLQMADEAMFVAQGPKYLICESPVWVSEVYMKKYFMNDSNSERRLKSMQDLYANYGYDIILHCGSVGKYEQDGVRYQQESELPEIEKLIKETVSKYHKGTIIELPAPLEKRKEFIDGLIGELNGKI